MKRFLALLLLLVTILVVQFAVLPSFPFPISAAVFPLSVYILLLYTNTKSTLWWAVILGLIWDSVSYYRFGVYIIAFVLTAAALHWAFTRVVTNTSFLSFAVFVGISTLVYSGIVLVTVQLLGPGPVTPPFLYHAWILLQSAASTGFLALLGYITVRVALRSVMPTHI